jgi:hypothetical protein
LSYHRMHLDRINIPRVYESFVNDDAVDQGIPHRRLLWNASHIMMELLEQKGMVERHVFYLIGLLNDWEKKKKSSVDQALFLLCLCQCFVVWCLCFTCRLSIVHRHRLYIKARNIRECGSTASSGRRDANDGWTQYVRVGLVVE